MSLGSTAMRTIVAVQLACVVIGTVLLVRVSDQVGGGLIAAMFSLAGLAIVVTIIAWRVALRDARRTVELTHRAADERLLKESLEAAIRAAPTSSTTRSRVLQRMWWLGQQ